MDMVLENIRYERRPPIAVVTLDRPRVLNALNRQSMTELEQVFLDIQKNAEVRAVLLTGAGEKALLLERTSGSWLLFPHWKVNNSRRADSESFT